VTTPVTWEPSPVKVDADTAPDALTSVVYIVS